MSTTKPAADSFVRGLESYAQVLGCCVPTVRKLIANGTLPSIKVGAAYMTTREALIDAVAKMGKTKCRVMQQSRPLCQRSPPRRRSAR
jgi:excisionase family DNA binding protein